MILIAECIVCYHENIYVEQDVYYFFDEIQYAQDWDKWLKTIYDMQPDTQVVATGSASLPCVHPIDTTGAGDIFGGSAVSRLLELEKPIDARRKQILPILAASPQLPQACPRKPPAVSPAFRKRMRF